MKVYGPYLRKDGRKHVIIIYDNGQRRTVSYPKYIMEEYLDRELDPDLETVDHIDRNIENNNISNLRIIERKKHASEDAERVKRLTFICPMCKKEFTPEDISKVITERKRNKAGPFCSKSCAGKYGAYIQYGYIKPFKIKTIKPEYYKTNKTF